MTRGQAEARISEAIVRFEREETGLGVAEIKTTFIKDAVFVRMKGVLTAEEKRLAATERGRRIIKEARAEILTGSRNSVEKQVSDITGCKVACIHTDVSGLIDERIYVFVMDANLEERFERGN